MVDALSPDWKRQVKRRGRGNGTMSGGRTVLGQKDSEVFLEATGRLTGRGLPKRSGV